MKRNLSRAFRVAPRTTQTAARHKYKQVASVRAYTVEAQKRSPGERVKFVYRVGPSSVPIELWPMGIILGAGLAGAGYAIYRHLVYDQDVHLNRKGRLEEELDKHK